MATPFEKASGSPAPEGNGSAAPAAPPTQAAVPTSNVAPLTSGAAAAAAAAAPARSTTPGGGLPRVGSDEPMRRPMSKRTNSLSDLSRQGSNPLKMGVPKRVPSLNSQVEARCRELGGDRAIHSVLVANNGLAAVKFIRSVRSWAYKTFGNERAVAIVAMATPEDMRIDAEHIRMADQFVEVPGGSNNNNYANVPLIVQVADRANVDAVWPGWGHASEKPELPTALSETPSGIRFLGPPAAPMAALGDKIGSTIIAQAAGVPTIPWSGTGVAVDFASCNGVIPPDVYDSACLHSVEQAVESCNRIGYPVMLKASWGGGGKGIRKAASDEEVRAVFGAVKGEVPGSPIFAMKLAPPSRHLEVQLLADAHGNVTSIYSRDCSVQRRHQKIVEEGPVSKAPPETLREMERCARALARAVGYVGAATVEYLYALGTGEFFFLELNPRLQVEHPVTEWISGVNIPSCQLLVGMGVPLHRIPDVRRMYGRDPAGVDAIDFEKDQQVAPLGHVVAVRVTSEDANDGFKPTCGNIDELSFRTSPEVWGYFSVKSGGGIHEFSDSQFGHLFAKGETREAAIRSMVVALKEVKIRGEIRTIVDYAVEMIQSPDFVGNEVHTGWLDSRIARHVKAEKPAWYLAVIAGALLRCLDEVAAVSGEYLGYLEKGQLPPAKLTLTKFETAFVLDGMKYEPRVVRKGPQAFTVSLGSGPSPTSVDVVARRLNDGGLLVQVDGGSHVVHSEEEAAGTRLTIDSLVCLLASEADPSRLASPSPGKLVRHLVADGEHVNAGEPFAEIEVMKMLMPLSSPAAGKVNFRVQEGSAMAAGDLIAQLDLDDPTAVERATPYAGGFPELGPPLVHSQGVDHRFTQAENAAKMIMAGYDHPVDAVVADLLACLDDPALALLQWTNVFSVVQTRLPVELANELERLAAAHEQDLMCAVGSGSDDGGVDVNAAMNAAIAANANAAAANNNNGNLARAASSTGGSSLEFPARALLAAIKAAVDAAPTPADGSAIAAQAEPLVKVARAHQNGKEAYARAVATELFEDFLAVEEKFSPSAAAAAAAKASAGGSGGVDVSASSAGGEAAPAPASAAAAAAPAADGAAAAPGTEQEVIDALRRVHAKNLGAVVDIVVSHMGLPLKVRLASRLMAALVLPAPERYRPILRRFAALGSGGAGAAAASGGGEASALAAQLLEHSLLAELQHVVARALSGLEMFAGTQLSEADLMTPRAAAAAAAASASSTSSIFGAADAATSDAAAADSLAAAVENGSGSFGSSSHLSSELQRRPTIVEGLYSGLSGGASLAATQLDAKVRLLVEAPAAVDDALASLLDSADATLQQRALSTYIQRVYYPFITRGPELCGGDAASAASANPAPLAAAWAHEHPGLDGTPSARVATSAALVLPALDALAAGLRSVEEAVAAAGLAGAAGAPRGTLHIVLTRGGDAALSIAPDAVVGLPAAREAAAVFGSSPSAAAGSDPLAVDPRPAVAAITAAVRALNATISAAGYEAVSVLVKPRGGSEFVGGAGGGMLGNGSGRSAAVAVAPLRVGLVRPRGDPSEPLTPDPLLSAVEPPTAALLELARLAPFGAGRISYAPSRNRQAHAYAVTERRDARSLPLKRVFIRGALRQLSSPALLAATYKGDAGAIAAAVMDEVDGALEAALRELQRGGAGGGNAAGAGGGSSGGASSSAVAANADWAHVFLTVLPPLPLPTGAGSSSSASDAAASSRVAAALRAAAAAVTARHGPALRRAGLAQWEVRLRAADGGGAWRVVVASPTGHETGEDFVSVYREGAADAAACAAAHSLVVADGVPVYQPAPGVRPAGPLAGHPLLTPYPPLEGLQQKRLAARRHRTTYCYDFPSVFENALRGIWAARAAAREPGADAAPPPGDRLVDAVELVMPADATFSAVAPLVPRSEAEASAGGGGSAASGEPSIGRNDCGMVIWRLTLRTPECPSGRRVIAVANDITFNSGAFGPREDAAFLAATEHALAERLPIVYLAANSGARVGLASEVKAALRVEWNVADDPTKGFKHLYLDDADYQAIVARSPGAVRATPKEDETGGRRWIVSDIVGAEDGLGVENLSGSGAIASAYSRAFREGFSITLVSGRTVGIGAYLARLGRRCVQRADQPIILTGFAALNKVLGREVYSSHMQLGGPKVMGVNGVAHHVVGDDLDGVAAVLTWLSYVPPVLGGAPPLLASSDPTDRDVTYYPNAGAGEKLDPRAAIAGRAVFAAPSAATGGAEEVTTAPASSSSPEWQSGLFDKGSWTESQAGWARTVVTGRARLGGVPVGVVAVETQTVMLQIPADPGAPDSSERTVPQAGQVWFPDSALKTAHAIEEFDAEGLPLVILANWRGFSGGQRDLFEGVLQAGSLIVDALRAYRQPAFVYLPPGAELRGGAWVVVDAQINAHRIEMYADPAARGGVLEPEGLVEIKFRTPELLQAMGRLDPRVAALRRECAAAAQAAAAGGPSPAAAAAAAQALSQARAALAEREAALLPAYRQVATAFADMHDTPVRMVAKGVLRGIVPWRRARAFLALRLKRRLAEDELAKHVAAADAALSRSAARALLRSWCESSSSGVAELEAAEGGNAAAAAASASSSSSSASPWEDDRAFLTWASSPAGGAAVAAGLRQLRAAAAAAAVANAADSVEGRDGLVAALEALLRAEGASAGGAAGGGKLRAALEAALGKKK